jgi:S1-C subfamily serine protease
VTDPDHPSFLPPGHPSSPTVEQPVASAPFWHDQHTPVSGPPLAPGGSYELGGHLTPPPIPPAPGARRQDLPSPPPARARRGGNGLVLGVVAGAIVGALVAAGVLVAFDDDPAPVHIVSPAATIPAGASMDVRDVLDHVQRSVVSIEVNGRDSGGLFGAAGSGVVISDDGLVLTNAHVIEDAQTITVIFTDGSKQEAEIIGSLTQDDIALVQVSETSDLAPATLGSSEAVQVGDEVLAIGNALDLGGEPSVTRGIVSAKDRSIHDAGISLENLIQTDAAINPGNSGGPLVNARGEVVGINTAIIPDAQNIGFSIAIDSIKPLIEDIKAGKGEIKTEAAFLGVSSRSVEDVLPDVLDQFGVTVNEGAFIDEVVPGSGAEDARLQEGDVIVEIDGEAVTTSDDVRAKVRGHEPGDRIEITIERDGERQVLRATLGSTTD